MARRGHRNVPAGSDATCASHRASSTRFVVVVLAASGYLGLMQQSSAYAVVLFTALGIGACSASDPDPPPAYSSGVDGNLGIQGLTPAQKTTLCTSQAAFVRARVDTTALTRFWCAFTPAVFMAPNDAACEAAMDSCIQTFSLQLDVTVSDPNAPPPQCYVADTSTCTGTVADYEGCVNALAAVQVRVGTDWACGKRTEYPSSPLVGVAACDAVSPTCTAATGVPVIH